MYAAIPHQAVAVVHRSSRPVAEEDLAEAEASAEEAVEAREAAAAEDADKSINYIIIG